MLQIRDLWMICTLSDSKGFSIGAILDVVPSNPDRRWWPRVPVGSLPENRL